ncbi:response regulator [Miltoncostaea marina]|uniref:response regulator n=1 Tax=Miltoncostaea marina TaxID=2843215 RepID=UPI001C3C6E48|nr:response regulator transcription factor [Miltoncostaea marina]
MRVVIAEDLALLRDGIVRLLRDNGMEVVAAVEDGDALVAAIERERPDVAVVDVRLPPSFRDEGLRAAIEARRRVPGTAVLVVSQYVEQTYAVELLADGAGGIGYLLKERIADPAEFVEAVRRVAAGGTAMDPEVVAQLVARRGPASAVGDLTPRERQVLELMAEGRSNAAIARALVVTEGAVEKHVSNIFGKLGLASSEGAHRRVLAVLAFLRSA